MTAEHEGLTVHGTVHLVGAGPGDPDLMTVRAARLLAAADVVVHDALVDPSVLALASPAAELIDVGKRPGRPIPQELITTLLVDLAHRHRCVVRLKGGDPYVFGRGGEEALGLLEAGIPFTVVPGVTSAVAAPALAGVPVTHRGVAAAVTVVTGHRRPGDEQATDWEALARVGGTIVVLMGVAERTSIAARLMGGGRPADTPVAVVERAGTTRQRAVRGHLDELGDLDVSSPATIVIGPVAALDLTSTSAPALAASISA